MRTTAQLRQVWAPPCTAPTVVRDLVPGIRISIDPRSVEAFSALGCVLQAHGYQVRRDDTGAYDCRAITGGSGHSLHAYGIATDINWNSNPYRADNRLVTDMSPAMIEGVRRIRTRGHHPVFRWGGDYRTVKDAMHFEVVASPDELATGIDWHTVRQPERDPSSPATWPTLHPGDRGPTVAELQRRLEAGLADDGVYGPNTAAAVRDYQARHGLTVDGIVGLQMWTALLTDQPKVEPGDPSPVKWQHRPELPDAEPAVKGYRPGLYLPDSAIPVSPRHRPASEVANGMDLGAFLDAIGKRLGPVMARLWTVLVDRALDRLEEEATEAIRERI